MPAIKKIPTQIFFRRPFSRVGRVTETTQFIFLRLIVCSSCAMNRGQILPEITRDVGI